MKACSVGSPRPPPRYQAGDLLAWASYAPPASPRSGQSWALFFWDWSCLRRGRRQASRMTSLGCPWGGAQQVFRAAGFAGKAVGCSSKPAPPRTYGTLQVLLERRMPNLEVTLDAPGIRIVKMPDQLTLRSALR